MADHTDTAAAARMNKVTVTDVGPSRKKLAIEVPAEAVDESLALSLDTLVAEAEIPGFRRGRAPRRLIEKKFGAAVLTQAKEQLVSAAFSRAVEEHKLRVIGNPVGDETLKSLALESGKPLRFEIEVEVPPQFELPSLEGIAVKKPLAEVRDEVIDRELNKLLIQEGRLEDREFAEAGDYLTGHARLLGGDGTAYFEQDGIVVQVPPTDKGGQGMIVGLVVDDLGAQLGAPRPGQKLTVRARGPENHEIEALRGKDLVVEYTPARADRIVPTTPEELVTRFGMPDEGALRGAVRQRLYERALIEQAVVMRRQVARWLLQSVSMELPERVTASQSARNLERRRLEMLYRGLESAAIEQSLASLRSASNSAAANELKLFFVLDRAAEQLGVRVSEGEVNGRIAQIAAQRGERPEKIRQQLIASNQVSGIVLQIREHKTLDAILAKATVTEMSPEEFAKALADDQAVA
ncbi:MAG: trigger factor [Planctomyces sp.]|nr:trigger factor [Planctomyces sp.]MBA4119546.1 trigger factor [Isosphaera sp.]